MVWTRSSRILRAELLECSFRVAFFGIAYTTRCFVNVGFENKVFIKVNTNIAQKLFRFITMLTILYVYQNYLKNVKMILKVNLAILLIYTFFKNTKHIFLNLRTNGQEFWGEDHPNTKLQTILNIAIYVKIIYLLGYR